MEREKLESMLIDYIDGTLNEKECREVEAELERSEIARALHDQLKEVMVKMGSAPQLEPGEALRRGFDHFLSQEIARKPESRSVKMVPMFYRIAAGIVILMVTGVAAYWIRRDLQNQDRLAKMERELEKYKKQMMGMLNNEFSPSQRMQGVSVAYEIDKPDDEIVNALVSTLNNDPNTNVRLAALDALGQFAKEKQVRKELIKSLSTQKDPVVQIALIQLMVKMKEKGVVKQLERMTKDTKTMKAVRDEAYSGIFKLS
ncbi:MAG TPA: HEAT repeat domain-containing protein [Cyclobacteriaceae bacterium]|nr:HEAT repeat domain-containing protein [Cyclobacteriaceae bacterium]HMV10528.1 HEAT repeat domain-containing protein [Cyclobacteriaceae bacterium]HMV89618.1 HEAT repeat domain-containing protein [Cyclobacteriaceae bacterium]HMW99460.1 HEAT repeat domain-containing protein [Cyclobacteriaceae bacterium]HMX48751.1 HEAT repeat domain-containing protein [Cyclobacteriaceae bacterium]